MFGLRVGLGPSDTFTPMPTAFPQHDRGVTALHNAVVHGRYEGVRFLLSARASVSNSVDGLSPLHTAAVFNSGVGIMRLLVQARGDINARVMFRQRNMCTTIVRLMGLSYRLGKRSYVRSICYQAPSATPLIMAVIVGALAEAKELLAARADPTLRNARGADAQNLALRFGNQSPWRRVAASSVSSQSPLISKELAELELFSSSAGRSTMSSAGRSTTSGSSPWHSDVEGVL